MKRVMILISKQGMTVGSIIGMLILVYGTAILYKLLMGNYLFEGGLADLHYVYLALLCAIPFVIGSLIVNSRIVLMSVLLFAVLFVVVHWAFVFTGELVTGKELGRMFIVLPASALLLTVAIRVSRSKKEQEELN